MKKRLITVGKVVAEFVVVALFIAAFVGLIRVVLTDTNTFLINVDAGMTIISVVVVAITRWMGKPIWP